MGNRLSASLNGAWGRNCLALALLCVWFLPGVVDAQRGTIAGLAGTWHAGTTSMNVKIDDWGPACGERPESSRARGGGTVEISVEGPELIIQGQSSTVRTDSCWSSNRAMRRNSSRFLAGKWTTHCETPPGTPRMEVGTYSISRVSDVELRYNDVSAYRWEAGGAPCVVTTTTVQTLHRRSPGSRTRVVTEAPEELAEDYGAQLIGPGSESRVRSPASPGSGSSAGGRRCAPKEPAKISMNPIQAELELGQEMCVVTRVVDAAGCPLPPSAVTYRLEHSPALRAKLDGHCFRASEKAAEGEGEFRLIATAGEVQAESRFLVTSMDLSSLIAKRLEINDGVSGFDPHSAPKAPAPPPPATRVQANEPKAASSGTLSPLLLAIGGSLALLAAVGLTLARRRRSVHLEPEAFAPPPVVEAELEPTPPVAQEPRSSRNPTPEPAATRPSQAPRVEHWICPNCRQGFATNHQGHCARCLPARYQLVPYREYMQQQAAQEGQKRCVSCNKVLPGGSKFCGNCGSRQLTPEH